MFYTDPDSSPIGLAILSAPTSTLGSWQVKLDANEDWTDLNVAPQSDLIPKGFKLEQTHRGPLKIDRFMGRLACKHGEEVSLTTQEDAKCWAQVINN